MIAKDYIVIRKAILHSLDTNRGECILSNTLLDPGPDLHDFIRNHIYKIVSSDDTKNCEFDPEYSPISVSYTHLDVYKRQVLASSSIFALITRANSYLFMVICTSFWSFWLS